MKAKKGDYILVERRLSWTGATHSSGGESRRFAMDRAARVSRDGVVTAGEVSGKISAQQQVAIIPAQHVDKVVVGAFERRLSFSTLTVARRVLQELFGLVWSAKPYATIDEDDIYHIDDPKHSGNMIGENPRRSMAGYIGELDRQGRSFIPTVGTTLQEAKMRVASLGFTIKKRDGEYILTRKGAPEDDATYYTDDLNDAIATAHAMHVRSLGRFEP